MVMVLVLIYVIVLVERAQRKITIQYPKRQVGARMMTSSESSHLPLKINPTGVIPPISPARFAAADYDRQLFGDQRPELGTDLKSAFGTRSAALSGALCRFDHLLCLFYTAVVFNPEETADNLKNTAVLSPASVRAKTRPNILTMSLPA